MSGAGGVVAQVVDPEMPMLTLDDLGVIRSVSEQDGTVTVTITPTYSGCPAIEEMRADIRGALTAAGYTRVEVRTVFSPPGAPTGSAGPGAASSPRPASHRPERPAHHRADPADAGRAVDGRALPTVRVAGDRGALALRPDRVHRAAPVHDLP